MQIFNTAANLHKSILITKYSAAFFLNYILSHWFLFGIIIPIYAPMLKKYNPKVKVETQFSPASSIFFEAAGMKRLSVGMGLHNPTAPPHR